MGGFPGGVAKCHSKLIKLCKCVMNDRMQLLTEVDFNP